MKENASKRIAPSRGVAYAAAILAGLLVFGVGFAMTPDPFSTSSGQAVNFEFALWGAILVGVGVFKLAMYLLRRRCGN